MKMDFIYKKMEIKKVEGGKYQLLNHNGELMFQGTKEQCYLVRQNMMDISPNYEWEYMDRIRNGYHSHEKPNNESESLVDETN
jgi:hypothetical protein